MMKKPTSLCAYLNNRYVAVNVAEHTSIDEMLTVLNNHYHTKESVESLFVNGFIVHLATSPEKTTYMTDYGDEYTPTNLNFEHYYEVEKAFSPNQYGFLWVENRGWSVIHY